MAEKKRYGALEMDPEQKKRLDKTIVRKPFHTVDPEIKEMILAKRKGMPRIIDIHTHPYTKIGWRSLGKFRMHLEKYLYKRADITPEQITAMAPTEEEWVQPFRELGVAVMPCGWAAETTMAPGDPLYRDNTNDDIAAMRDKFPDVCITGWGSVDPWKGWKALEEVIRCHKELKLIGIKFQQVGQAFHVNDKRFYPLWDLCQELGMPIQLHTGFTGLASGAPGGLGTKIKYTMQLIPDIDDISADFPNLKIIMLHISDGRDEDAVLLCRHKGNIYRELSGIWPEYIEHNCPHTWFELNRRQRDKYMFGSEMNLFPLDGILYQHHQLEYREGILEGMFWRNPIRILGEEMERCGINLKEWRVNLTEV
ncbi:MAG TPA: amidohydrolase family protein [Syntrophales bacterium]|nr:amidohydrolase family protein [Syntrophales bacterium]HPI58466.1 amidohydrolase family protein [Syntrophales bacterium]HPN25602.1 amidohydrolase family protein [Syntrophales bacterium]HQM28140.1 amidohydrolase family protein [Syntrophales bacterium]